MPRAAPDAHGTKPVPAWSVHPDLAAYYESNRSRPEDLYPSEARFLPWLARQVGSVLDVGCAAGGFRGIWQAYASGIRYEGVDVSPVLVDLARRLHPGSAFHQGDATEGIDLPDRYADVVQALGWLHWVEEDERALSELWRLARRFLFFDARIGVEDERRCVGRQRLELTGEWDGKTTTPYVVVSWPALAACLASIAPVRIYAYGYLGSPAPSTEAVPAVVCFATFVLERGDGVVPQILLDLPLEWPPNVTPQAEILPLPDPID